MATKCEIWVEELKVLKSKTSSLTSTFNSLASSAIGYIDAFQNGFGQYNCGETLKAQVLSIRGGIQSDNPNSSVFLTAPINIIQIDAGKCKGGSFNCSKEGCVVAANSVNSSLLLYYNSRKALVQNLLDIKSKESQIANDPECKKAQEAATEQEMIDQDKNRQIRNGIIWFVVVTATIGVLAWLDKKYFHILLK